jgi:hypothetical protein
MVPKEKWEIEIEKNHPDPLPSICQRVTQNCSDFLGTLLMRNIYVAMAAACSLDGGGAKPPLPAGWLSTSLWDTTLAGTRKRPGEHGYC